MKVEIVNRKVYGGPGYYVGRPSILGNPFVIGPDGSRLEVIRKYEKWFKDKIENDRIANGLIIEMVRELEQTGRLVLICWCAPLACHAEVIKKEVIGRVFRSRRVECQTLLGKEQR